MVQYRVLDRAFAALSDPTRRGILDRLGRGPTSISELAAPFDMTLTGLKKHVKILEDAHLVTTQKVGRVRQCRIDTAALKTAEDWITERRTSWERRLDRLGDYLAENGAVAKVFTKLPAGDGVSSGMETSAPGTGTA